MDSKLTDRMLDVSAVVQSSDALEPALGTALAKRVITDWSTARVLLDFSGVSVVSSAFANAFFVTLGAEKPFEQLPAAVDFLNLKPRVSFVWTKSFQAVRDRLRDVHADAVKV